jgi:hypothetical protein
VLAGQFQVYVEEVNLDGTAPALNINISVHVSGWKSIMGDPSKRKSRSSSKKKSKSLTRRHIAQFEAEVFGKGR